MNVSGVKDSSILNVSVFVRGNPNILVFSNSFLLIYLISNFLELISWFELILSAQFNFNNLLKSCLLLK